jgi:plasmid replication initiation protein
MSKNKGLKPTDKNKATQSNKLIEAAYKISVPAKRVMLMLLGQIHPGQQDVSKKVRIEASDYAEKTGISLSQSYVDIKNGCSELMGTIIKTKDHSRKTTSQCVVVSWMEYHDNEGWLEATFTQWIAPYIHSLSRVGYTTIAIDEAIKFKRFYTIRLYELIMQWESTGERYIKIEDLRDAFQVEKTQYPRYSDFRRWVIEPSVSEITQKTARKIQYKAVKTGKKITSLVFSFDERIVTKPAAKKPRSVKVLD